MKRLILAAALLVTAYPCGEGAFALTLGKANFVTAKSETLAVSYRYRRHHHRGGGLFSQWCSYNCHLVPRGTQPPLGAYGYNLYAYDQDIPFRHSYDWDASPIDNALALPFAYLGPSALMEGGVY